MRKPLPVTTSTFRDIIDNGFLYVDKTRFLYDLIRYPKGVYFLARPRRFGKSLMISTLEEIFRGSRDLFQGLWRSITRNMACPIKRLPSSAQTLTVVNVK